MIILYKEHWYLTNVIRKDFNFVKESLFGHLFEITCTFDIIFIQYFIKLRGNTFCKEIFRSQENLKTRSKKCYNS